MSNDMIITTYKLATIAMVEGAVLLWMGLVYGFWIMYFALMIRLEPLQFIV